MADFVSNFLEGLQEKRQREDIQAARAEQTRQFERQAASRMFEFNANRQQQQEELNLRKQQQERIQTQQDFQNQLSVADLFATGQADESIEGIDETMSGPVIDVPGSDQRIRMLSPEEKSERQFQLDMGLTRNKLTQTSQMVREEFGEEFGQQFDALVKRPDVMAETLLGVKTRQQALPQSLQGFIVQGLQAQVEAKQISPQEAQRKAEKLFSQQQASETLKMLGPLGGLTNVPSAQQQETTVADIIRPLAPGLAGMTVPEILANKEAAINLTIGGIRDAMDRKVGPFAPDATVRLNPALIETRLASIARRIIEDIIQLNKESKAGGSDFRMGLGGQPNAGGSNLTDEQRRATFGTQ